MPEPTPDSRPMPCPVGRPEPGDRLVGRNGELLQLKGLLATSRLVTVCGPPGVGKSRVATEAARRAPMSQVVRVTWRDGVPGRPGALREMVDGAVADAARTPAARGCTARTLPPALLFLDDIDPVHDECMRVVERLLASMPRLRILVTARGPLGLGEERVVRLPALACDSSSDGQQPPAVRLFLARAGTALRHRDHAAIEAVTDICRTLEGLPLAIELAAAQLPGSSPRELAERLEHSQCWLSSPHPTQHRHRSLSETLGHAYTLCGPALRKVWSRTSVLAGAFGEETAMLLCAGPDLPAEQVPGRLAQLADLGLLRHETDPHSPGPLRYGMVRPAREFGLERLAEADEHHIALDRLAAHCRQVARIAEDLWVNGCQAQAMHILDEEHANLHAFLRQSLAAPEVARTALGTATRLWFWWVVRHPALGVRFLLQLSAHCPGHPSSTTALWLASWLSAPHDPDTAHQLLGRLWPDAVLAGDTTLLARISHVHGLLAQGSGDPARAAASLEHAADLLPEPAGNGPTRSVHLAALAVARCATDPRGARHAARSALAHPCLGGDLWSNVRARYAQALVDYRLGRPARAWKRARRALDDPEIGICAPRIATALESLLNAIGTGRPLSGPCWPEDRDRRQAALIPGLWHGPDISHADSHH